MGRGMVVVATWIATASACGWLSAETEPRFTESTELTPPWSAMSLPVQGAKVTFSDKNTASVHHADAQPKALTQAYGSSLGAAGWALDADTSAGDIVNQTWTKDDKSLALSILAHDGSHVVSLSILEF